MFPLIARRLKQLLAPVPTLRRAGLTGGIGAGKSEVAGMLRQHEIPVIDLDLLSRQLLETDADLREALARAIGVPLPDFSPATRRQLRDRLFADAKLRRTAERVIHPRVLAAFDAQCRALPTKTRMVVCEAALLVESGHYRALDPLVVVYASEATRLKRLIERDRVPKELAEQMLRSQTDDEKRIRLADRVIDNSADLPALAKQVNWLIEEWKSLGWI